MYEKIKIISQKNKLWMKEKHKCTENMNDERKYS